jgi:Zn-dependent membrane protease YugP
MLFLYSGYTFLIIIPGIILSIWAQYKIKRTYETYSKIPSASRVPAGEFISVMLRQNGVHDVSVRAVRGNLTDHYDPRNKTISLSEGVHSSHSVAAIAIAAHEAGHALQYHKKYTPVRVRGAMVPVLNVVSSLAFPLLFVGIIMRFTPLITYAAWAFFALFIFQLVTLPVEVNASRRALSNIRASGVLTGGEVDGAKKVLTAAALTYLAALLVTFLQFLSLSMLSRRR